MAAETKPTAKPTAKLTTTTSPIVFRCFKRKDGTVFSGFKAKLGENWETVRAEIDLRDEIRRRIDSVKATIAAKKFAVIGYGRIEGKTLVELRRGLTAEEIYPAAELLGK